VYEHTLTPADIHQRYRVLNGAIYGLASHGRFTGAFKPGNLRTDVPGLYLAGGAAHPGPGMPMVLMSGWIAADSLDQDGTITPGRHEKATQEPQRQGEPSADDSTPSIHRVSSGGHSTPALTGGRADRTQWKARK
jgi:hypothetical protein